MIRCTLLIAALLLPTCAMAQVTATSSTRMPTLKAQAVVAGPIVRIRDLVDNAGVVADVAIFRAPDPGETGTVETARVIDAIRPYKLVGIDTRGLAEVSVTRSSRTISAKQLEQRIAAAIARRPGAGAADNLAITFDRDVRPIEVDPSAAEALHITRLAFDPTSRRFDVSVALPGLADRHAMLRYTGVAVETAPVIVPLRAVGRGELIRESDVSVERRPKAESSDGAASHMDAVVGMAAKRPLRIGQPVRTSDLMRPEAVRQNEAVTITYERPGIVLSIRGKALESGAEGDIINVLNVQSKRTLQTTVTGPGRVVAAPQPSPRLSSREGAISVADAAPVQPAE